MKCAIGIVGVVSGAGFATVDIPGDGVFCIANKNSKRWRPGEPVLVEYEPADQWATLLDPHTLAPQPDAEETPQDRRHGASGGRAGGRRPA